MTIILTTHYMEEAEVLCDRIAIMDHAKIIALDTPVGLIRMADTGATIEFHVDRPADVNALKRLTGVEEAKAEDHVIKLVTKVPATTLPALFTYAQGVNLTIKNMQMHQATLEDVFLKLTGRTLRE